MKRRLLSAFDWFFFSLICSNFAPGGPIKSSTRADSANLSGELLCSTFLSKFCVSIKLLFCSQNTPARVQTLVSSTFTNALTGLASTRALLALRGAAPGALLVGMARDKHSKSPLRGILRGRKLIKVHQRALKRIPMESDSWGGIWIGQIFFPPSAQPSCGKERGREMSNLPQMEPLCPVTCELRRVLKIIVTGW